MEATVKGRSSSVPKKKKGFSSFYTKGEEIFNAVSHIVGGAFGVAAWIALCIFAYPSAAAMVATSVFCCSIIVLYTMSALYHFLPNGRAMGPRNRKPSSNFSPYPCLFPLIRSTPPTMAPAAMTNINIRFISSYSRHKPFPHGILNLRYRPRGYGRKVLAAILFHQAVVL